MTFETSKKTADVHEKKNCVGIGLILYYIKKKKT